MSSGHPLVGQKPEGSYAPGPIEARWGAYWRQHELFRADADSGREPFTILIPPPNVTGSLHIGHCLNNATQDVIIRHRRMRGYEALWLPGTDHAGIATQNVVEKKLLAAGKTRHDLGRAAFVAEVWRWKEEQHDRIVSQLDALGCSCDWSRERFTLDPVLSRAVRKVFVTLYDQELIYRGDYIVNWCPRCHTALSDEEVEHEEARGTLTTIRYPLAGGGAIAVATTRPETMLGDTAVAVHPDDERYRGLIGRSAILPLLGRELPIIGDPQVDPAFGTGAVKVTPAHDPNDFQIAARHGLPAIKVMDGDGRMNENAGPFAGLDRFEARSRVLAELTRQGLVVEVKEHVHTIGHCQRCETVIEPMLSRQWFVRMKPLAEPGLEAVLAGRVRLHPERWRGVYRHWMENVRDWCISRQLWWGHRIPAWTCAGCGKLVVAETDPASCPGCGGAVLEQDEDVLDTWFSSWLWPFSTMGWPERTRDLEVFYPTQFLSTAPDIIFFWVARMIMAGLKFMGDAPFADVTFHAIVRDGKGRKMSKSLGNSPDPLAIIAEHGADALRFTLMFLAPTGQDQLLFDAGRLETGRVFSNKVWNAAKLVIGNLDPVPAGARARSADLTLADRWILSRLAATRDAVDSGLEAYRIQEAAKAIYDFFWHEYCDWYLELAKIRLYGEDESARNTARLVAYQVLEASLRLLHPIMPFVTEDLWQRLPHEGLSIARAPWPEARPRDLAAEADMEFIQQAITAVRTIRSEMNVPPGRQAEVLAHAGGRPAELLLAARPMFASLARARLEIDLRAARPAFAVAAIVGESELFVPLRDLIDLDVERRRLEKEQDRVVKELANAETRLASSEFLARAPAEVVARERERLGDLTATRIKLARNLAALGGGAD